MLLYYVVGFNCCCFNQPRNHSFKLVVFNHLDTFQVLPKRTNVPGMKQYRPRCFNPYMAYGFRRPYTPYLYSPYGYGYLCMSRLNLHVMPSVVLNFRSFSIKYPAGRFLGLEGQIVTCRTTRSLIGTCYIGKMVHPGAEVFSFGHLTLSSFSII